VIPPDKRSVSYKVGREEYYVPAEAIVFDEENPFPAGFAEFEWEVTSAQLENKDTIEFYVINVALDKVPKKRRKIEDLEQIGRALEYSTAHRDLLEPRIFKAE
jgi:hypothetical protein